MITMTGIKEKAQRFVEWQKLFSIPTRISWALAIVAFLATVVSVVITAVTGDADGAVANVLEHTAAYTLLLLPLAVIAALLNALLKFATKRKIAAKAEEEAKKDEA